MIKPPEILLEEYTQSVRNERVKLENEFHILRTLINELSERVYNLQHRVSELEDAQNLTGK